MIDHLCLQKRKQTDESHYLHMTLHNFFQLDLFAFVVIALTIKCHPFLFKDNSQFPTFICYNAFYKKLIGIFCKLSFQWFEIAS